MEKYRMEEKKDIENPSPDERIEHSDGEDNNFSKESYNENRQEDNPPPEEE